MELKFTDTFMCADMQTPMLKMLSRNRSCPGGKSLRVNLLKESGIKVTLGLTLGLFSQALSAAESPLLLRLQMSAMTGDLRPVELLADRLDESDLDALSLALLRQFRARFSENTEQYASSSDSTLANFTIAIYRDYWRRALTHSLTADEAEQKLQSELHDLLRNEYPAYLPGEDIFIQLQGALAANNLPSSLGQTPPWRDLYIWTQQETRRYEVELTDVEERVDVTLIEQPLVQGWQHFASLDLTTTSGWATAQGLFCLCWSYDLNSEAFRLNWLKHETRHLVDFREFPGLSEAEMEYRAKLTELAFAGNQVSSLLRQFANSGLAGSPSAHSAANYRVSHEIYREIFQQDMPEYLDAWALLGPDRVAPAAVRLLERDTDRLKRGAGPQASSGT